MVIYSKSTVTDDGKKYVKIISWFMGILISIDQLGNAIACGNPDNTISARIGYSMTLNFGRGTRYWRMLEFIVNTTFKPIDGIDHCFGAYYNDRFEDFTSYEKIKIIPAFILFLIIVIACVFLFIINHILIFFFPKLKSKFVLIDETVERGNKISALTDQTISIKTAIGLMKKQLNYLKVN